MKHDIASIEKPEAEPIEGEEIDLFAGDEPAEEDSSKFDGEKYEIEDILEFLREKGFEIEEEPEIEGEEEPEPEAAPEIDSEGELPLPF